MKEKPFLAVFMVFVGVLLASNVQCWIRDVQICSSLNQLWREMLKLKSAVQLWTSVKTQKSLNQRRKWLNIYESSTRALMENQWSGFQEHQICAKAKQNSIWAIWDTDSHHCIWKASFFICKQTLLGWKHDVWTRMSSATYAIDFNWIMAKNYFFAAQLLQWFMAS